MRYWSAVASWGVAIVGWMGFWAWGELVAFGMPLRRLVILFLIH